MYEYKIVRIACITEKKTRQITNKKGKTETETYNEVEPLDECYICTETMLNALGKEGWSAVNASYALPVVGRVGHFYTDTYGYSETNDNAAEFVVLMQREQKS